MRIFVAAITTAMLSGCSLSAKVPEQSQTCRDTRMWPTQTVHVYYPNGCHEGPKEGPKRMTQLTHCIEIVAQNSKTYRYYGEGDWRIVIQGEEAPIIDTLVPQDALAAVKIARALRQSVAH